MENQQPKFCLLCKIQIATWKRKDSKFCSDECRKKYFDLYRRNLTKDERENIKQDVGSGEVNENANANTGEQSKV